MSTNLFFNNTDTNIKSTEKFFQTDHMAVITNINTSHILREQSLAKRKT